MGVVELVIYIFLSIWGIYITYLLFELFFDTSHISIKQKLMMFGIYNIATDAVYLTFNIPMITLGVNVLGFIIIGLIYNKNIKKLIIPILLILLIVVGGEGISLSIIKFENFYLFKDNPLVSMEMVLLTRVTTHFMVLLLRYFKNIKSEIKIPIKHHIAIIGISAISFYVTILLIGYREIGVIWRTAGIIGMVIINMGIFYLYNMVNGYIESKIEKVLYQKESQYYLNQSEILKQSLEQDHKMRHDIKNNLQSIQFLIEKGEYKEAMEYIDSIENYYKLPTEISKTGVTIIDSILNYKLAKAKDISIDYTLRTSIPNSININYFDVGIVLGNMLDNAFEALDNIPEIERKLNIDISNDKGILKIVVENTYNGNVKFNKNQIITIKEDKLHHGQGLKIINSIAEKYGNYIDIEHGEKWFKISILLLENQS